PLTPCQSSTTTPLSRLSCGGSGLRARLFRVRPKKKASHSMRRQITPISPSIETVARALSNQAGIELIHLVRRMGPFIRRRTYEGAAPDAMPPENQDIYLAGWSETRGSRPAIGAKRRAAA